MELAHAPHRDTLPIGRHVARAHAPRILPPALPAPFDAPPRPDGPLPGRATRRLVQSQVSALLQSTPAFAGLPTPARRRVTDRLVHIAAYAAELLRDDWAGSARLGQRPLVRRRRVIAPETARAVSADRRAIARSQSGFEPAAAGQIGRVTEDTLNAIAFPTFVADLIRSTFQALVNTTIQQMEAFVDMLENVSKTVDEFMVDNISDEQARGWLAQRYPTLVEVEPSASGRSRLTPRGDADEQPLPDFRRDLGTPDPIDTLDEDVLEEVLVPAARRRLAQTRLQMLSTMVMMGLQRIVVKHGRIRATMGFHIDASDRARAEEASLLDTSVAARASGWYLGFSASVATSVTYVRSTKAESDNALNVRADLTGEVDLTFETDYLPLGRVASAERIERIRANTPNPAENPPSAAATSGATRSAAPGAANLIRSHLERREAIAAPEPLTGPSDRSERGDAPPARRTESAPAADDGTADARPEAGEGGASESVERPAADGGGAEAGANEPLAAGGGADG